MLDDVRTRLDYSLEMGSRFWLTGNSQHPKTLSKSQKNSQESQKNSQESQKNSQEP